VDAGFDVVGYDRAPNPGMETAFEQQAAEMMATAAGPEIAHDVRDVVAELRPGLMVVDCMPGSPPVNRREHRRPRSCTSHTGSREHRCCAARARGRPIRAQLNITHSGLGLEPAADDIAAWESVELLLVTVPEWFDLATEYPANVVHAGPLGFNRDREMHGVLTGDRVSFSASAPP
jgi:hypothetical protein